VGVTTGDLLTERIPDPDLRRLAEEGSEQPVSVIIELAVPDTQVEYAREGGPEGRPHAVRVTPMSGRERDRLERTATAAKKFLEDSIGEQPVFLPSARSFVATVTGKDLAEIARQSFTKRIARNRTLPATA
jgi:hypothetical protein